MNLKKSIKRLLIVIPIILIGGLIAYKIAYKPHAVIQNMKTDYKGTLTSLLKKVEQAPDTWNNKTVEITGKVTQSNPKNFMMGSNVYCEKSLNTTHSETLKIGASYHIKGRIIGYDDLLEELKLDKVILINE